MGPSEDAAVTALYSEPTEQNNQMQSSCRHLNVKFSREKNSPFHLHALEFFFFYTKEHNTVSKSPKGEKKKEKKYTTGQRTCTKNKNPVCS